MAGFRSSSGTARDSGDDRDRDDRESVVVYRISKPYNHILYLPPLDSGANDVGPFIRLSRLESGTDDVVPRIREMN